MLCRIRSLRCLARNILQGDEVEADQYGGEAAEESSIVQIPQCQSHDDLEFACYCAGGKAEAPAKEYYMTDLECGDSDYAALRGPLPAYCAVLQLGLIWI